MRSQTLVIIPAYNEEKTLAQVIADVGTQRFAHVVVIDDGSRDKTGVIARNHHARDVACNVSTIRHILNRGMGAATQTGIECGLEQGFEYFVTIDADGQQRAVDLVRLCEALENHDCVLGSRFLGENEVPWFRRVANRIANVITGVLFGVWVTDSQSGLRGFTRDIAEELDLRADGFEFASAFVREVNEAGFQIHEVPISVRYTAYSLRKGQSFAEGLRTLGKLCLRAISR